MWKEEKRAVDYRLKILTYEEGIKYKNNIFELMKEMNSLYDDCYCLEKTDNMIKFLKDETAIIVAAIYEESIIGYLWGYLHELNSIKRVHITQFVVSKKYRSNGIGKQMLNYMNKECIIREYDGIELNVSSKNEGAYEFYKRNGFVTEAIFMSKLLDKE